MLTLDTADGCLIREGSRLPLSPKDFALLEYLLRHRGLVVPHAELLQAVWPDVHVTPEGLKVRIQRVRRLLGDTPDSPRFIRNVHGEGYGLLAQAPIRDSQTMDGGDAGLVVPAANGSASLADAPVVGREGELARLMALLMSAARGTRQMVFVSGEPGIGKTTLISRFVEHLQDRGDMARRLQPLWVARGQCVEQYGRGEAYLPVMDALGRLARGAARDRLKAALHQCAPAWLLYFPALLANDERLALQRQFTQPTPDRMVRQLAEALDAVTTGGGRSHYPEPTAGPGGVPLLILALEDLHWADPSTIDLLAVLAHRPERARLLVVGSYRPSEVAAEDRPMRRLLHQLRSCDAIREIELGPLVEPDIVRYLDARFPESRLPAGLAGRLHQRTEGNPLFLTEVIRELLSTGLLVRTERGWILEGDIDAIGAMTPASIRQLVTRHAERLPVDDRHLLEAASAAGLEFSAPELASALDRDVADVEDDCLRLAEQHQSLRVVGTSEWPDGTEATRFGFLHALYREKWQERAGARRRQQWHLHIGHRKEAAYGSRAPEIASELAVHFTQGREYGRAIAYHEHASRQAVQRAATAVARTHLDQAFALLERLPESPERLRQELRLQLGLGSLLAMMEGYGAAGTAKASYRAHEICARFGDVPELFDSIFGLCRYFWIKRDLGRAGDLGEQLLRIASHDSDPVRLMAAHSALAQVLAVRGELTDAVMHAQHGLTLSHAHWNDALLPVYGPLPLLCAGPAATASHLMGHPEEGSRHLEMMLEFARASGHPFALALGYWGAAVFHEVRREWSLVQERAEDLRRVSSTHELVEFSPFVDLFHGCALAMRGRPDEGIVHARRGAGTLHRAGAALHEPHAARLLAECCRKAGRINEGIVVLEEALRSSRRLGENWNDAELHRLRGELTLDAHGASETAGAVNTRAAEEAERCFRCAIDIARRQCAKFWELRATLALGELWRRQGKREQARAIVTEM
jgi:DNA-binding winged helix-turn-helix (wHTH) protein/tetratricopeptide (TPR) repeat protein